jgi:hypothetical protein
MKRLTFVLMLLTAPLAVACGSGSNPTTPTPTPPANATVTAVTVTSATAGASTFQLTAMARLSDGTTSDVTRTAAWESSNTALATVSAAGLVTVVGSGDVDVRATYRGVVGSVHLLVAAPPAPTTFALTGVVRETAPNVRTLGGVTVRVTDGLDAGATATSDATGIYSFPALKGGRMTLEATADGYLLWKIVGLTLDADMAQDVTLFPVPPTDDSGATATARCNDGSWSWAATRGEACTANGGVAYGVCPGPLCDPQ